MSVSAFLYFACQPVTGAADALIGSMGTATEELADIAVRHLFPHRQPKQFLVFGTESAKGVQHFLILGAAYHLRLQILGWSIAQGAHLDDEPLVTLTAPVLVG